MLSPAVTGHTGRVCRAAKMCTFGALQGRAGMGMGDIGGSACAPVAAPMQPQPLGPWRGKLSNHISVPSQPPSPTLLQALDSFHGPGQVLAHSPAVPPPPPKQLSAPCSSPKHVPLPLHAAPTLSLATLDLYASSTLKILPTPIPVVPKPRTRPCMVFRSQ